MIHDYDDEAAEVAGLAAFVIWTAVCVAFGVAVGVVLLGSRP